MMKTQDDSIKTSTVNLHHVHYLRTGNTTMHKPFASQKGIHCVGDKFGYVVDWQVSEKKREQILAK